jgi:hypothetical protein
MRRYLTESTAVRQKEAAMKLAATFASIWEEGKISMNCLIDPKTGIVSDIEVSDEGIEFDSLIREQVEIKIGSELLTFTCETTATNDYIISASDREVLQFSLCQTIS